MFKKLLLVCALIFSMNISAQEKTEVVAGQKVDRQRTEMRPNQQRMLQGQDMQMSKQMQMGRPMQGQGRQMGRPIGRPGMHQMGRFMNGPRHHMTKQEMKKHMKYMKKHHKTMKKHNMHRNGKRLQMNRR